MLFMIDNIHNERGTYYTDSTLPGYYIMSVVCILYRYQDSALNHMMSDFILLRDIVGHDLNDIFNIQISVRTGW